MFHIENGRLLAYSGNEAELIIPDTVTAIDESAFSKSTSPVRIVIPHSVLKLESNPFFHCSQLGYIDVEENHPTMVSQDGVLYAKQSYELLAYPCDRPDSEYDIPHGVKSIGFSAFSHNRHLLSAVISDTVTSIKNSAFEECLKLKKISIPTSVEDIGDFAFNHCCSLETVEIQSGVQFIASRAFSHCYAIKHLEIPESVAQIGFGAFLDCIGLESLTILESVRSIGKKICDGCTSLRFVRAAKSSKAWSYFEQQSIELIDIS